MSHSAEFWCMRRLIVTVEGPEGQSVVPLARPFARIGREPGSDIVLNSPWVARRSMYLHATDEGVFCFYLQPEEREHARLGKWLAPGEPLIVGPYRISACLEGDASGPAPAMVPLDDWGSAFPPYPVFQVYSEGKLRDKRRFRARLNLIGRRHECSLQIKGQQVSAFHGCLFWHYPRLWYVDLVSSNGTTLNGQRVQCAEVRVGDRLDVGEFTLLFHRLSKHGAPKSQAEISLPTEAHEADQLPPDFDDDLPLELDADAPHAGRGEPADVAGSSPAILLAQGDERQVPDAAAPAPIQETRQELALLQQRVAELTRLTAQVGQQAAKQLAVETRDALERERRRIEQELQQHASDLAKEKEALEAQWQSASRELTTHVNQLRDEATLLARQRQAMEQSRMQWDSQRSEMERQLRTYAEQLRRLEQSADLGLPPPRGALENCAATAMVLAAAQESGALAPRSQVVDSRVEGVSAPPALPAALPDVSRQLAAPPAPSLADPSSELPPGVLEGSISAAALPQSPEGASLRVEVAARPALKGRKSPSKGKEVFDRVTDRMVEMEQNYRRKMLLLWIAGAAGVVVLAAAMIAAAVLLR